jgi:putative ATPase
MIPLSTRMRPTELKDFVGQKHFLYRGSLLYNAIQNGNFTSAVFFGPSGTGKTTLARIIANALDAEFVELNASMTGIKELKASLTRAEDLRTGLVGRMTCIFVDEFHRWNRLQQDTLLSSLEEGRIKFIAGTTENPYFSINNAILSRVGGIYEFKRLDREDIMTLLLRALDDKEKAFGNLEVSYETGALKSLAELANGDARVALDRLGFIIENMKLPGKITEREVQEAMQRKLGFYDREDDKYDLLSALQKSIRGSDPDAAIHYFARLVDGGAEIETIGRRLLVIASEDIGMAYPSAISIVTSCVQAAMMTGYPEACINLAEAVILLASSPKSNKSYMAYEKAAADVRKGNTGQVPPHLRDSHYKGAEERGFGIGYKYPHEYGGYVKQQYLPDELLERGISYYEPTENGAESGFKKFLESLRKKYGDN